MNGLRGQWVVTGGILIGEVDPLYTRSWSLSAAEYDNGRAGLELFLRLEAEAGAYARHLQILSTVHRGPNWTRVEFTWF